MTKTILKIEPMAQMRPRFARAGNYVKAYEKKEMKLWRRTCAYLIKGSYKGEKFDCAVKLSATFYIKPPQYISKVKKNAKAIADETMPVDKTPDLDNYLKALMDSMKDSGVIYKDDGRVSVFGNIGKFYSNNPRIEFEVSKYEF